MKKIVLLFLALFLTVTVADAGNWLTRPTTVIFNDCPTQLSIVRFGLNYVTSGENIGKAHVYVTVDAKSTILFGCAYFKVFGPTGNLIFQQKQRIRIFEGSEANFYATVPAEVLNGVSLITGQVGVGCDCNNAGF